MSLLFSVKLASNSFAFSNSSSLLMSWVCKSSFSSEVFFTFVMNSSISVLLSLKSVSFSHLSLLFSAFNSSLTLVINSTLSSLHRGQS